MNRNRYSIKTLMTYCGACALAFGLLFTAQSCTETVDSSNFAIANEKTIADYLATESDYSGIKKIFDEVRLGSKSNASVLSSALSARGNYTIFVPTNAALDAYAVSLYGVGKTMSDLTEEDRKLIAYSCIIDNGTETAFESPEFPQEGGAFSKTDLNDRSITCKEVTAEEGSSAGTYYLINGKSKVVKTDVKLSNGYLHVVETVIAPSNDQAPSLIKKTPNMQVMAVLLEATGLDKALSGEHFDADYENEEREQTWKLNQVAPFNVAQHRYLCYTGFVETDDVFQSKWGIPAPEVDAQGNVSNREAILAAVKTKCEQALGTTDSGDLTSSNNAVNRFVAYHFIKGRLAHNQFVQHFNEWGYKYGADMRNPQQKVFSIDVWDYFVTAGKERALIKVMQDAKSHDIFINRHCTYAVDKNYENTGVVRRGIKVAPTNEYNGVTYDNNSKNGYFFPIDDILILDESTANALGSERIRMDLATMLPELLSYGCRAARAYTYFPRLTTPRADGTSGYFEDILNESEDTRLLYLHAAHVKDPGWRDYQGDEFMVAGIYDFTLRIPSVPKSGTYEIRMGTTNNTLRGMCQVYFGESPESLVPTGLPLDMRQPAAGNDNIGWVADGDDADVNAENDKNMRNHGYMKAPKIFTVTNGNGGGDDGNVRKVSGNGYASMRVILTTQYLEAGKSYYLRFKSALDKSDSQFFSDYLEFVPRNIYNGTEPEDIW